jgi:SAM-dependent methyltransferase
MLYELPLPGWWLAGHPLAKLPPFNLDAWKAYPVWARHLIEKAKTGTEKIRVLKADANNEAYGDDDAPDFCIRLIVPHISDLCEVSCIELNQETVDKASNRFPELDIRQGDVTTLPYENESFHVVLDLSTIDHVHDYWKALDEYKRILKPNGTALIVVWLDTYEHEQPSPVQFWFNDEDFCRAINSRFKLVKMQSFDLVNNVPYPGRLFKFVVRKEA